MQQAYQALRVIYEAQTVHIVLPSHPGKLAFEELCNACTLLHADSNGGIKAVILDFDGSSASSDSSGSDTSKEVQASAGSLLNSVMVAVSAIQQPVLLVARATLSDGASQLLAMADFTLVARDASLSLSSETLNKIQGQALTGTSADGSGSVPTVLSGFAAQRRGYVTWAVSAGEINREMERILERLRTKSAVTLRHARASVRLGQSVEAEWRENDGVGRSVSEETGSARQDRKQSAEAAGRLEALRRVNQFYVENVLMTEDAREGLQAFQEKRQPHWKNR